MGVAFHPTKNLLASCSYDKSVKLWNTDTGAELSTLKVDYAVDCLSYAPNGDILAVGDRGGNINFFNSQGEKLQSPVSGEKPINCVAFSPDGSLIAAGDGKKFGNDRTGKIRLYDAASGAPVGSPLTGQCGKDNPKCTCKSFYKDPECPVTGHRYVPFPCIECLLS